MKEPIWLTRSIIETIHVNQIKEHGGQYGLRDEKLLESAISRPLNRWLYEQDIDVFTLAAAYGFGFAKTHSFVDGNKRLAFMAMYTFLGLNGYEIIASEPEVVDFIMGVADNSYSETELVLWLRTHSVLQS